MKRTCQTAELFRQKLCPNSENFIDALREQNFGDWHGKDIQTVWSQIQHDPIHNWSFFMPKVIPPNGESFEQQIIRVAKWCKTIESKNFERPQIVFTHGGTIRALMAHMLGISSNRAQSISIAFLGYLHVNLMNDAHAKKGSGGPWQIRSICNAKR